MDVASYRKQVVLPALPTAVAKKGVRVMSGNKRILNIGRAMVGTAAAVSAVLQSTDRFVIGVQMNDEIRSQFRTALGDLMFFVVAGAKELKVKVPASTKKVKPKATMTELLMQVNSLSADILNLYLLTYSGKGLALPMVEVPRTAEEMQLATEKAKQRAAQNGTPFVTPKSTKRVESEERVGYLALVKDRFQMLVPILYELSWAILNEPIANVLDHNAGEHGIPVNGQ